MKDNSMGAILVWRCGWGAVIGFMITIWFGAMLGTPIDVWLRLLSHFVSTAILFALLTTFLEQNMPAALCIAAYGALLGVFWGGVARLIIFAELHHELSRLPDTSHFRLPPDWWQSLWFWPGPIFIGLLLMSISLLAILFDHRV